MLLEYVCYIKGHKNSKGEDSPWVIKSHKTNKVLSSHKTEKEAKKHLQQMHIFGDSITLRNLIDNILNEEATDDLAHYAPFRRVARFIKNEKIGGTQFSTNKNDLDGTWKWKDSPKEICLVRKTNKNISGLSEGSADMGIKIYFDMDNIKNIRNIKKPYPIAELPMESLKRIWQDLTDLEDEGYIDDYKASNLYYKIESGKVKSVLQINQWAMGIDSAMMGSYSYKHLIQDLKTNRHFLSNREMEERLDLTKNSIPVSSKYVKFEILKEIPEEYEELFAKAYKKDPDLFVKNKYIRRLMSFYWNKDFKEKEKEKPIIKLKGFTK